MLTNWILKVFVLLYGAVHAITFFEYLTGTSSRATSFPEDPLFKAGVAASFPGGKSAWIKYLNCNLNYPLQAKKNNVGAVIKVHFMIDTAGNVVDVNALNDVGYGFLEEAERVIKKSPRWKPARLDGKKIQYRLIQPVTFRIQ